MIPSSLIAGAETARAELGLVQSGHSGAKLLQLGGGAETRRAAAGM